MTAITESRIRENVPCSLNIEHITTERTPTEVSAGDGLMYINHRLSFKPRSDQNMYAPRKP